MIESEAMEVVVRDFRRAVRRRVEFALQRVAFALDLLLGEMFRGELPANWREQLAAVLAAEASDGRRVTPESARALEEWIEWWAGRCGLLPGQSNRSKGKQADVSIGIGLVVSAGRGSGGLPAQVAGQELLAGLPEIDWKSLDASPTPPLMYALPGDPAADPTVLPDSPEAEQMGNWIEMVHFNQRIEERRQKEEAEQQSTAFEILASAAGVLVEPLDYLLTGWEIYNDPTSLTSYAGLVPGIPAGAGKILKHADEAAEIAGAAARGIKGADAVEDVAKIVSAPRTAVVAEPSGSFYSAAFETRLSPTSYPGVSRGRHFQEANESLLRAIDSDHGFAQSMRELGVTLERTPTGLAPRTPPAGWTWHHGQQPGTMQLVPQPQHTPGSIFWDTLHPNGAGGYSIWGQ